MQYLPRARNYSNNFSLLTHSILTTILQHGSHYYHLRSTFQDLNSEVKRQLANKWDHMVFVFLSLAYFAQLIISGPRCCHKVKRSLSCQHNNEGRELATPEFGIKKLGSSVCALNHIHYCFSSSRKTYKHFLLFRPYANLSSVLSYSFLGIQTT